MFTATFSNPYFTGATSSTPLVPDLWDVALNGRTYRLDLKSNQFRHRSVPMLRNSTDQASSPSEATINPEDLWRRSMDTWHLGAGQSFLDRPDSTPGRFFTSKGVDPWTKWQITLLPDTAQRRASSGTNLRIEAAGTDLYLVDGTAIYRTQDVTVASPTWTALTSHPANAATSITSDGFNVWSAHGSNGIYTTTRGAAALSSYVTGTVTLVKYVKARLMAANANSVYNVTASGVLPAALFTHANTDFAWVGFAEGPGHIFMAGYAGDKSLIYKTAIKADATALDAPSVAGELPDGEIIRSIQGYVGFVLLGTDQGVRFAAVDGSGNLTIGSLIRTPKAVQCFEGQDRFVWFGLTDYDNTSTGLGRLDLSSFTADATPAYASDLMCTTQGEVLSVATFQNRRVFTVSESGVWAETTTPVTSGTIESGNISYRLPHTKVAMFLDVTHDGKGSHSVALAKEGGAYTSLGTHSTSIDPFPCNESRANYHAIRVTMTAVAGVGPTIKAVTLRAYPAAPTTEEIIAPLLLHENILLRNGSQQAFSPLVERGAIRGLREARELVIWQEGTESFAVVVDDYEWQPHSMGGLDWQGTLLVKMKVIQ